ncbi:F0F1 ATP synthase subunit delta [Williamsoniiplasma luminosum]|uniref:ATP synthase subunit delta n=1 Tax=Williamsoniiplasma luminosum TaxID=214888 RepID=A0A2K8NST0_9MOLU|nr:F0F1 ATP synthase subunit delta [Williamsoniiplasma luminosum]ATZ16827.1 F0F1 ATP synthase subunit delta [Williamsoniiplasma luminosum]AVP49500.1 MAG: ATP synthase F1 subunit delta [Williamsoniiplasma luminosum]
MILKESVIESWGDALKRIAIETKQIDRFVTEATVIIDALKDKEDFVKILAIRSLGFEATKKEIIDQTFTKTGVNEYFINAFKILCDENTFNYARVILKNMRKKLLDFHNIIYGVAWSTKPLTQTQMDAMQSKLTKKFNKEIHLVNKIDLSLIGGVMIIIANHVFDGSIKGQIDQLHNQILIKK